MHEGQTTFENVNVILQQSREQNRAIEGGRSVTSVYFTRNCRYSGSLLYPRYLKKKCALFLLIKGASVCIVNKVIIASCK